MCVREDFVVLLVTMTICFVFQHNQTYMAMLDNTDYATFIIINDAVMSEACLISCLIQSLRKILFGNTFHIFNYEWKKSFFKFREPYSNLSYALEAERVSTLKQHLYQMDI